MIQAPNNSASQQIEPGSKSDKDARKANYNKVMRHRKPTVAATVVESTDCIAGAELK